MKGYMRTISMPLYNFSQFEFVLTLRRNLSCLHHLWSRSVKWEVHGTELIIPTSFVIKKCKLKSTSGEISQGEIDKLGSSGGDVRNWHIALAHSLMFSFDNFDLGEESTYLQTLYRVPPLKVLSREKLILARLGVSRRIYISVDSPNLGFPYFNFLGGYQWKKSPCTNPI